MDILRVLSRSTNLQRSLSVAKKPSDHPIPSAGPSAHSHIQGEGAHFGAEHSAPGDTSRNIQGKKRKRDSKDAEALLDLDFFGVHGEAPRSTLDVALNQKPDIATGVPIDSVRRLSIEECRRIFRTHKLKVTLMDQRDQMSNQGRKRQKVDPMPTKSRKKTLRQLDPQPLIAFRDLRTRYRLSRRLAENLDSQGYTEPTEVQLGALPLMLGSDEDRGLPYKKNSQGQIHRSDIDLLTIAPTGSGKTLAFLIPILHGLLGERHTRKTKSSGTASDYGIKAVIVAPTHELVDQLVNEGKKLALGTGLKVATMKKGMSLREHRGHLDGQKNTNTLHADILVATPLNLIHALSSETDSLPQDLSSVHYLVLDEADVLLDPMFRRQTLAIWEACTNDKLQTSLWSATIGSSIETLAQSFISERRQKMHLPSSNHHILRLVVGLKDSALSTISHRLVYTATEQGKLLALRQLLHPPASDSSIVLRPPFLVFTQTIARATALHSELLYDISPEAGGSSRIAVLHSDLSDSARSSVMTNFRKGEIWVIITTDLLSRGVDFRGVNGVINYDIPNTGATYIHRAGRTGRAGREGGIAVTLYTKEDIPYVKNVANVIAASDKVRGEVEGQEHGGVQKWLLDALPTVSKKTRQELKKKGVEARRAVRSEESGGKEVKRMRISTKSGFDRRLETKKKGAIEGNRRKKAVDTAQYDDGSSDDEWGGIED